MARQRKIKVERSTMRPKKDGTASKARQKGRKLVAPSKEVDQAFATSAEAYRDAAVAAGVHDFFFASVMTRFDERKFPVEKAFERKWAATATEAKLGTELHAFWAEQKKVGRSYSAFVQKLNTARREVKKNYKAGQLGKSLTGLEINKSYEDSSSDDEDDESEDDDEDDDDESGPSASSSLAQGNENTASRLAHSASAPRAYSLGSQQEQQDAVGSSTSSQQMQPFKGVSTGLKDAGLEGVKPQSLVATKRKGKVLVIDSTKDDGDDSVGGTKEREVEEDYSFSKSAQQHSERVASSSRQVVQLDSSTDEQPQPSRCARKRASLAAEVADLFDTSYAAAAETRPAAVGSSATKSSISISTPSQRKRVRLALVDEDEDDDDEDLPSGAHALNMALERSRDKEAGALPSSSLEYAYEPADESLLLQSGAGLVSAGGLRRNRERGAPTAEEQQKRVADGLVRTAAMQAMKARREAKARSGRAAPPMPAIVPDGWAFGVPAPQALGTNLSQESEGYAREMAGTGARGSGASGTDEQALKTTALERVRGSRSLVGSKRRVIIENADEDGDDEVEGAESDNEGGASHSE